MGYVVMTKRGMAGMGGLGELSLDNEQRDARAKAIEAVTPLLDENRTLLLLEKLPTYLDAMTNYVIDRAGRFNGFNQIKEVIQSRSQWLLLDGSAPHFRWYRPPQGPPIQTLDGFYLKYKSPLRAPMEAGNEIGNIIWEQMNRLPGYVAPQWAREVIRPAFKKYLRRDVGESGNPSELAVLVAEAVNNRWGSADIVVQNLRAKPPFVDFLNNTVHAWIRRAYNDHLSRNPDPQELTNWSGAIFDNWWDEERFRQEIAASFEAGLKKNFKAVMDRMFNSQTEYEAHAALYRNNNWTEQQYRDWIPTNVWYWEEKYPAKVALVRDTYLFFTGTPVGDQELIVQVKGILSGNMSDGAYVTAFCLARFPQRSELVRGAYMTLLKRAASEGEFIADIRAVVKNNVSDENYLISFMQSKLPAKYALVNGTYGSLLSRQPTKPEIVRDVTAIVVNAWSDNDYVNHIKNTAEYKARHPNIPPPAPPPVKKPGTVTAGALPMIEMLKNPWALAGMAGLAVGGYLLYWTQVEKKKLSKLPYVGQYLGKAGL